MDSHEPALKPEWLKSPKGSNSIFNRQSNDLGVGLSTRTRLPSLGSRENGLAFSPSKRSLSSNSRGNDRDNCSKARAYSSFGRSSRYRDRDRDRNKDFDYFDRESRLVDNGFHNQGYFGYPLVCSDETDTIRRSQSVLPGMQVDCFSHGVRVNTSNTVHKKVDTSAASFEREFPSLGSEDKTQNIERNCSPSLHDAGNAHQNTIGTETWNSLFVEGAKRVSTNSLESSPIKSAVPCNQSLAAQSAMTNLKMPETSMHASSRVQRQPQLSYSSEKLMTERVKDVDAAAASKVGFHLLSQPVLAPHVPTKFSSMKLSQLGSMLVLNRENVNVSSLEKEKASSGKSGIISGVMPRNCANQRPKLEIKVATFAERKTPSHARERHEFFNFIRSKASNGSSVVAATANPSHSSNSDMTDKENGGNKHDYVHSEEVPDQTCCGTEGVESAEDAEAMSPYSEPDPEEEAFLRSLGWDANAVVDALTKEEIDAFNMKYKEWMKFSQPPLNKMVPLN